MLFFSFFFLSWGLSSPEPVNWFLFSLLFTDTADTFSLLLSFFFLLIIDYSASPFSLLFFLFFHSPACIFVLNDSTTSNAHKYPLLFYFLVSTLAY